MCKNTAKFKFGITGRGKTLMKIAINKKKALRKAGGVVANTFKYIFFISFGFVVLYPFIYILLGSFMGNTDFLDPTVQWIPKNWNPTNILAGLYMLGMPDSLINTIVLQMVAGLLQFCSCAVAAYGLARFNFKGRGILNGLMILHILVPTIMVMVPNYVNYSNLDFLGIVSLISKLTGKEIAISITNTPLAFWIPSILGVGLKGGLFIYIYAQFYRGLPKELEEAAWIDGAGPIKTFLRIVVPSSGSASITVLLFTVVWHWNEYFTSQMYASNMPVMSTELLSGNYYTLIEYFGLGTSEAEVGVKAVILAACLLFLAPLIIFYCIIQRKFVASIATSGIVG